jgi:hypothetical protein
LGQSSASQTCKFLPDFPVSDVLYGAIGGYGYNNEPLVCGGYEHPSESYDECYAFVNGAWTLNPSLNLTTPRGLGATAYDRSNYGDGRIITAGALTPGPNVIILFTIVIYERS